MSKHTPTDEFRNAFHGLDGKARDLSSAISHDQEMEADAGLGELNIQLYALLGRFESHLTANYDWY